MGEPEIIVVDRPVDPSELRRLVVLYFGDMVKFVADLDRKCVALGGELHADAESILLASGSQQASLWGGNYYPGKGEERCIEFTALINIRPGQGNPGMELQDSGLRDAMRAIVFALIGRGTEES